MKHVKVNDLCLDFPSDRVCKGRLATVRRSHNADAVSEFTEF